MTPPTILPDDTAAALAIHLRSRASQWRVRRVDRIHPLHFYLLSRNTSLDVLIAAELLRNFASEEGVAGSLTVAAGVPLADWSPKTGDSIQLILPVVTQA